jgi:hypothetical protein
MKSANYLKESGILIQSYKQKDKTNNLFCLAYSIQIIQNEGF